MSLKRFTDKMKMRIIRGFIGTLCALIATGSISLAGAAEPDVVWPLPPEKPRIKFMRSVSTDKDVEKRTLWKKFKNAIFGKKVSIWLKKPYGVHVDNKERIFVADTGWGKLLVFDFHKNKLSFWGMEGEGLLSKPSCVTSDNAGKIYVTDTVHNRAVVYSPEGDFLFGIGEKGRFEQPSGIAVNEEVGRLYIVDTKKHNVSVFDMAGKFLFDFGKRGTGDGEFNFPTFIAIGPEGKVHVVDTFNFRVQIFDPEGRFLFKFGSIGDMPGQFSRAKGIGIDSEGNIYVVDAAFNNIQIFNDKGQLLLFFGKIGRGRGDFWLPAGMHIRNDLIYVADQYNYRINIYKFLGGD